MTETRTEIRGATAVLRLHRPEARNALTDTMMLAADAALSAWEIDPAIRAVVIAGTDDCFCAGGDLKASAASADGPFDKYFARFNRSAWHNFVRHLGNYPKPVIAAVEGPALGGGLEIALRCDFIVGSASAKLGLTEAKFSLFPILGGAWLLAEAVGERLAKELIFTARHVDANEALRIGLVNQVVPAGQALTAALETAGRIGENGPLAVALAKQAVGRARSQSFEQALLASGEMSAMLAASEDRVEGLTAFREKRKPNFKGK
jgi:enoyl-CoA hydratase